VKWVKKIKGKIYVWFPSLGVYLTDAEWRRITLKIGKDRMIGKR